MSWEKDASGGYKKDGAKLVLGPAGWMLECSSGVHELGRKNVLEQADVILALKPEKPKRKKQTKKSPDTEGDPLD